jgi:hypothetical protein
VIIEGHPLWNGLEPPDAGTEAPAPPSPAQTTSEEPAFDAPGALEAARESDRASAVRRLLRQDTAYSTRTTEAIAQIEGQLDALRLLKPALVGSGHLLERANKLSPTGKIATWLAPSVAQQADAVALSQVEKVVELQQIRSDLTAQERVLWNQIAVSLRGN